MRLNGSNLELSASDLSQFLGCRHRTALDLAVACGERQAPDWIDPVAAILRERGLDHERSYAESLRATGLTIVDLAESADSGAEARTLEAMRSGAHYILQPALRSEHWFGRPDVLLRAESPSGLGAWSYEVVDTKLARDTRGGTILQLALYSELLGVVQEVVPREFHVVTTDRQAAVQSFRVQDFAAYFRLIRSRLAQTARNDANAIAAANYPEPVDHCEVCRWRSACDTRRHLDDHLCLVAGISRLQTRELQTAGLTTLAQLGTLPLPLPIAPRRGAMETYVRVREQARVQLEGRTQGRPVHELLPIVPDRGLARLPPPAIGDMFLDIEGDPFARDGNREYLFGLVTNTSDLETTATAQWALSDPEERLVFEAVVDEISRLWAANPRMHVYHYSHYEPTAFKRLMSRYATREVEVDRMLRAELFVDLYAVVRHSIRASVESYSIKDLEPFYGFTRTLSLSDARTNLRLVERALELGEPDAVTDEVRKVVEAYNRDDCFSALRLRTWLEQLRSAAEAAGTVIPRPPVKSGDASERVEKRSQRVQAILPALLTDVPAEARGRNHEQQARWLLAQLLEWHRRENKAPWWEFYRLRDLSEEELLTEKAALAGLRLMARVGGTRKSPIDQYEYPRQDTEVRRGDRLHLPDGADLGSVESIDRVRRTVDIKKRGALADSHPTAVFAHSVVNTDVLADAILRVAEDVNQHGVVAGTRYGVARALLLRRAPRVRNGLFQQRPTETAVEFAVRVAGDVDDSVLAIQGPPGSGKTYTGARMICELVRQRARVGVTAVSHEVIRKLLKEVAKSAAELQTAVTTLHKVTDKSDPPSGLDETTDNDDALTRLADRQAQVVGGTQWLWARPEAQNAVDVLVVDEAGQMSLANVLAASQAARCVVLLGDPQQLEQPQQGIHPEGADCSALQHILGEHQTMPPEQGIFLPETWRLPPSVCAYTSEMFYEGRVHSLPGLERQRLVGAPPLDGAGLWLVRVTHDGNQNSSYEEAGAVESIVSRLLRGDTQWIDRDGLAHALTGADILVIAPYNSHVTLLQESLVRHRVSVGTVDKFQGQEAPVVIYSMATSIPEDAPRGMEFLYSLNRLNVATSRAKCACILVASPRLFEPECRSPRQMQLANALCRYVELATSVDLTP